MMERLARSFHGKVDEYLTQNEREQLFSTLRIYQEQMDVGQLVMGMRDIVSRPSHMRLYEEIRPLIPLKHQMMYDWLVPHRNPDKLRVIRLKRKGKENLGFAVKGGLEHGIGVFVSQVTPGSQAEHQGLKVGDQIVRLNGFTLGQAIHEEVLNLIRSSSRLVLKVKSVGLIPLKSHINDAVSWKYADSVDPAKALQHLLDGSTVSSVGREVKLVVTLLGNAGLGCSICTGPPEKPGIFIQSIKSGSLAEEAGLEVGDQIVSVNGTLFQNISHSEAVVALKESRQIQLIIRKGTGLEFFKPPPVTLTPQQLEEQANFVPTNRQEVNYDSKFLKEEYFLATGQEKSKEGQSSIALTSAFSSPHQPTVITDTVTETTEQQSVTLTIDPVEPTDELPEIEKASDMSYQNGQSLEKSSAAPFSRQISENGGGERKSKRKESYERSLRENLSARQASRSSENIVSGSSDGTVSRPSERNVTVQNKRQWRAAPSYLHTNSMSFYGYSNPYEQVKHLQEEQGSVYTSHVGNPNFRIQKPVLLSPIQKGVVRSGPLVEKGVLRTAHPTGINPSSSSQNQSELVAEFDDTSHRLNSELLSGRQVQKISIRKEGPLEISIEGGTDSPLEGRVIVSEVFRGGTVYRQGGIHNGDQLLMVDDVSLLNVSLTKAQEVIAAAMKSPQDTIQMLVAKPGPALYEEEIVWSQHTPTSNSLDDLDVFWDEDEHPEGMGDDDIPISFI